MPRNKVKIAVTFVTMKPGTSPSLFIDNPTDLTDIIGGISSYSKLQDAINYLVEDGAHSLFFHLDARHKYFFDGVLSGGVVDVHGFFMRMMDKLNSDITVVK